MARIPDAEIERLKKGVPVERLVMGFGVELKRHGAELIGTCRFMTIRHRRWWSRRSRICGIAVGACHVGGSMIDWVLKTRVAAGGSSVFLQLLAMHPEVGKFPAARPEG
jgi:DNA primase